MDNWLRQPCQRLIDGLKRFEHKVSPLFVETTRTVNEAICEGTPFAFELVEYDEQTGKSIQRFYRRSK